MNWLNDNIPARNAATGIWNDQRLALARVLKRQDRTCFEVYQFMIDSFGTSPLTRGALMSGSHSVRELLNLLPSVLGHSTPHSGIEMTEVLKPLVSAWEDSREAIERTSAESGSLPTESVAGVLTEVETVSKAFRVVRASAIGKGSALALGNADEVENPTALALKQARDVFEEFRHIQGDPEQWPTEIGPLLPALRVIENVIEGRIGDFFHVADELRSIVEQANSRDQDTGDWAEPSDELIATVISRIGELQHRRIFFNELRNPKWASPLCNANALASPPSKSGNDDASVAMWPAGPYLVLVAPDAPEEVVTVLRQAFAKSRSHEVDRFLVKAANALPDHSVADLKPQLLKLVGEQVDPFIGLGVIDLVEKLVRSGKQKVAFKIGNALLRPRTSEDTELRRGAIANIEPYWYGKALRRFTAPLRNEEKLLPTVVSWMENALRAEGVDPGKPYDLSHLYRPSIAAAHEGAVRREITGSLTDVVRDLSLETIRSKGDADDVTSLLELNGFPLLKRIERHVLSVAVAEVSAAIPHAHRCLLDLSPLEGGSTPREYFELARAALPQLDAGAYRQWEELFLAGPTDTPERRRRMREHLEVGQTEYQAWTQYAERWLLDHLGLIGSAALRGRSKRMLAELTAALGEPVDRSLDAVQIVRSGDNGAAFLPQLQVRSTTEVIEFAREWSSPGEDLFDSSSSAMGQAFATVAAERAHEFSGHAAAILALPEPFASRFLDGLRNAADAGDAISWEPLLSALQDLPGGPGMTCELSDDSLWEDKVVAAFHLIDRSLANPGTGFSMAHVPSAVELATRHVHNSGSIPEAPASTNLIQNDPLSVAITSVQPRAVSTLIRLAFFEKSHAPEAADEWATQVLTVLDALLIPDRVPAPALAAAFGNSFARLHWIAPQWLLLRAPQLLSEDWYGDVVASIALLHHRQINIFLTVIEPKLSSLISRAVQGEDLDWYWTRQESLIHRIGVHLVIAVLVGDRQAADSIVAKFFQEVPAKVRANVLGSIGYALSGTGDVSPETIERAQAFWDDRHLAVTESEDADELGEFHTWIDSGLFPVDWWLPRLRDVADSIDLEGRTYLGKHLVTASITGPAQALEILDGLIRRTTAPWVRHDLVEHSPVVIVRAQDDGEETAEAAGILMNFLARKGYTDIAARVGAAREALA